MFNQGTNAEFCTKPAILQNTCYSQLFFTKMDDLLTKKEIKKRIEKIEALGMDCPLVSYGLKKNISIKELNELWQTERSIIKGAINDIELCL